MISENINFLKLNTENNAELIEDLRYEHIDLTSTISTYVTANLDRELLKLFESKLNIPTYQDLIKYDIDQAKPLSKLLNANKNKLNDYINQILSIDFREKFVFCQENLLIICYILIFTFGELKKYKVSTLSDLENKISSINFSKYNFERDYLKEDYLQKRNQIVKDKKGKTSTKEFLPWFFLKDTGIDLFGIDDINVNCENINIGEKKGLPYIDNKYKNYIYSSLLTKDFNYDQRQIFNKLLTNNCFDFKKPKKGEKELPIELLILLYKLKDIKTLVFQIKNANEIFIKLSLFILMNVKWLFIHEIEEIQFDLNDEEIQKLIFTELNKRANELYKTHKLSKKYPYFPLYYSRKYNFWVPEGDIIFEKVSFQEIKDYILTPQFNFHRNTFDNTLCNIYNENGLITNFKYIRPIINTINSLYQNNEAINEQNFNEEDPFALRPSKSMDISKLDRKKMIDRLSTNTIRSSNPNIALNNKKEKTTETTTMITIQNFVENYPYSFQLMSLFFYFFQKFENLKKFNIYFDFSHSIEIQHMFKLREGIYDRFHFLTFANHFNSLIEANFSFNSLDSNAFENILGIIKKNEKLASLKMSLFSQEIIYNENNLLYLFSDKNVSLNNIFKEHNKYLLKNNCDMERNIDYFILHYYKILGNFTTNIKNLFNLIKFESIKTLEEIILRFDVPIPILNSEKYIILLVKFILNLLIVISLQKNKVKTFKILAPELPFDAKIMPLIQILFQELKEAQEAPEIVKEKKNFKDKVAMLQNTFNRKMMSAEMSSNYNSLRTSNSEASENAITKNTTLEDITLNLKIYNLPDIFNIITINNLENMKRINIGFLDEITFISFVCEYKKNLEKLKNLLSLKISLCPSVISYKSIDNYILDYINTDSPILEEKYLFSNLVITEEKMNELIANVYYIAQLSKLIVQIGNDNNNIHFLAKLLTKFNKNISADAESLYSLRMIMDFPKYSKLRVQNILDKLTSFYCKKKNRMIICKEDPYEINA